jgi:hypothetical protein
MQIHNLTDVELIAELSLRSDLTTIEHELLDRLIRARDALTDLEALVPACGEPIPDELALGAAGGDA